MNVMHISTSAAGVAAAAVFEVLDDSVVTQLWNTQSNGAAVQNVAITPLDGASATGVFPTGAPARWSGGTGGDFVPASATIVKLSTLSRGRANRGRLFLPYTCETSVSDGFLSNADVVTMTAAWTALQTALLADADTPCQIVVASYDRAHAGAGAHASTVTTLAVEAAQGTQRRRQQRNR